VTGVCRETQDMPILARSPLFMNALNESGHSDQLCLVPWSLMILFHKMAAAAMCINGSKELTASVELDSHADTCLLGANFKVIACSDSNVTPYHTDYQPIVGTDAPESTPCHTMYNDNTNAPH
jgi:hypothetical protein